MKDEEQEKPQTDEEPAGKEDENTSVLEISIRWRSGKDLLFLIVAGIFIGSSIGILLRPYL